MHLPKLYWSFLHIPPLHLNWPCLNLFWMKFQEQALCKNKEGMFIIPTTILLVEVLVANMATTPHNLLLTLAALRVMFFPHSQFNWTSIFPAASPNPLCGNFWCNGNCTIFSGNYNTCSGFLPYFCMHLVVHGYHPFAWIFTKLFWCNHLCWMCAENFGAKADLCQTFWWKCEFLQLVPTFSDGKASLG